MHIRLRQEYTKEVESITDCITHISLAMEEYFEDRGYGDGVDSYLISMICVAPDFDFFHKKKFRHYSKAKRFLSYTIKLDFTTALEATEIEFRSIVTSAILDSLEIIKEKNIKDFDLDAFRNDLERLFTKINSMSIEEFEKAYPLGQNPYKYVTPPYANLPQPKPPKKKKLTIQPPEKAIKTLSKLLGKDHFRKTSSPTIPGYPGCPDRKLKSKLNKMVDLTIQEFIQAVEDGAGKNEYLAVFKETISCFEPVGLDTEEREQICANFEKIMDAIGLEGSEGIMGEWMYGYDLGDDPEKFDDKAAKALPEMQKEIDDLKARGEDVSRLEDEVKKLNKELLNYLQDNAAELKKQGRNTEKLKNELRKMIDKDE